jgi:hypothetical protein
MPTYSYRCPQCRTTSPRVRTHAEAEDEQEFHRDEAHGRHRPDGDGITCHRTERWSEADTLERWITVVLVVVVLLVLAYKTL